MGLAICSKGDNYFFAITEHRARCKYDMTSMYNVIKHVDITGSNTSIEELFEKFSAVQHRKPKSENQDDGGQEDYEAKKSDDITRAEKRIVRQAGSPQNFHELCMTLMSVNETDCFGNDRVCDVFIDNRSIRNFREEVLQTGKAAIIICRKTKAYGEVGKSENSLVLTDAFSYELGLRPKLLFVFETTEKMRRKIVDSNRDSMIAVFGRWKRRDGQNHIFECGYVSPKCIDILPGELFIND